MPPRISQAPALARLAAIVALVAPMVTLVAAAVPARAASLDFRGAPAFVETFGPNEHRGVVITVHGGAWSAVGPAAAATERFEAAAWAARGWTAVNVSYRPGARSLDDVLWFYDRVRAHVGSRTPVCLSGASAGGQLALMVAVRRADVACVIARGAPTDLTTIGRQRAFGPDGPQGEGPRATREWAVRAFGEGRLAAMSPALHAERIHAWVLLALADRDPFVPWDQALELKAAMPRAFVVRLSWGGRRWVHTTVSARAARRFRRAERTLARRARRAGQRRRYSSS